jgi:hypothetical protein
MAGCGCFYLGKGALGYIVGAGKAGRFFGDDVALDAAQMGGDDMRDSAGTLVGLCGVGDCLLVVARHAYVAAGPDAGWLELGECAVAATALAEHIHFAGTGETEHAGFKGLVAG